MTGPEWTSAFRVAIVWGGLGKPQNIACESYLARTDGVDTD